MYTIQGLDLFLDLLSDLSFSESVVESSVDIFQVSASASTWGSSSLGLGGPVELKNGLEIIRNQASRDNNISGLNSMSIRRSEVIFLRSTYSSSDGGSFLLDMISSSSSDSAQDMSLIIAGTSWSSTFSHFCRFVLEIAIIRRVFIRKYFCYINIKIYTVMRSVKKLFWRFSFFEFCSKPG